ncbi:glycosyltransferase [Limibaculum sp. M0105]|uniref:Glycosyltransferase n=1 Tax=Thermohalobaculum xanthum TaxID=2753746 RepID=A0A8J7M690_9RHOB|nr:glycosyltransferase [Thermohalobaculum xanthum]MBK0399008.1 glycosyltransferase [Thermohalobaculum xanthum]
MLDDRAESFLEELSRLRELEKYADALQIARSAVELYPGHLGLLLEKARLLRLNGELNEAAEVFRAAVSNSQRPGPRIELIQTLRRAGRLDEAQSELDSIGAEHADHPGVLMERVLTAKGRGAHEEGLELARGAVESHPGHHGLNVERARLLRLCGIFDEAAAAFRDTLVKGESLGLRIELIQTLRRAGRLDEAQSELDLVGAEHADHPGVLMERVLLAKGRKAYAEASETARSAVRRRPDDARLRLEAVRVASLAGDHKWALEELAKLEPLLDAETVLVERGDILLRMERLADVEELLDELDRRDVVASKIGLQRARLLEEKGCYELSAAVAMDWIRRLGARNCPPALSEVVVRVLLKSSRPRDAWNFGEDAIIAGVRSDQLRLMTARAAFACNDPVVARSHLTHVVMRHCPTHLVYGMTEALNEILYDLMGPKAFYEVAAKIQSGAVFSRSFQDDLDKMSGDHESVISRYLLKSDDEKFDSRAFIDFVHACWDTGQHDLMCSEIYALPESAKFSPKQMKALRRIAHYMRGDDKFRRFISRRLKDLVLDDQGRDDFSFVLEFEAATSREEVGAIAQRCMDFVAKREPGRQLKSFLALEGEKLASTIECDALAERVRLHRNHAVDRLRDERAVEAVDRERRLCDLINRGSDEPRSPRVSVIAPIHRASDLGNLCRSVSRQTWRNLEVIVVPNGELFGSNLMNSFECPLHVDLKVVHSDDRQIGKILNKAADLASGELVMRFDSDDIYLDNYVESSVRSMEFLNADVIGRSSYFVYIEELNMIFRHRPQPYFRDWKVSGPFAAGCSLCFKREVFDDVRFLETVSLGEDTAFCRNVFMRGWKCYDVDPFNFVVMRRQEKSRHTWNAGDAILIEEADCLGGPEMISVLSTPGLLSERWRAYYDEAIDTAKRLC